MDTVRKKESIVLETLADVYILTMIAVFPLIVDSTGFFHILECKWHSFVNISSFYLLSSILVILYYCLFKKCNYFKYIKFTWVQSFALIYLGVNILSFILSPYLKDYDLLVGVGRGEGLIVTSLYIITFIFISLFAKFKKKHIFYFGVSSILISLIMILQYIGFNPFNMYQDGIGTHNVSFMGTIGNKDFISAMYSIFLSVSVSSFIFLVKCRKEKVICLLSIFMGYFIFGVINVSSGKLAFLLTLVIFLPRIILNNERLSRFLIVIATILMAYCMNIIINPIYYYNLGKIVLHVQFNLTVFLFMVVCTLLLIFSYILEKYEFNETKNKKLIKGYFIILIVIGLIGLLGIYLINFNIGFLYEIHEILHGNLDDSFGTYRIFLWKRTLSLVSERFCNKVYGKIYC